MASLFYGLPLIAGDQAQKHVTANEATELLAALAPGAVESATTASPASPAEGSAWIVPAGGSFTTGEGVALSAGDVALRLGGFWHGGPAPVGHRVLALDSGREFVHVGGGTWRAGSVAGAFGSTLGLGTAEAELALSGASVTAAGLIPARCILLGVTSWVAAEVTGATSYDVGDGTTADRFGGTLGLAAGASNVGVIGPAATYAAGDVVVTANGGSFTGGTLRLAAAFIKPEAGA